MQLLSVISWSFSLELAGLGHTWVALQISSLCDLLVAFPPGYAATIHFQWPGKDFQLLGMQVYPLAERTQC